MVPGLEYQLPGEVQVEGTHGKAKLQEGLGGYEVRRPPCTAFIARTRFPTSSGAISIFQFDELKFECVPGHAGFYAQILGTCGGCDNDLGD